MRTTRAWLCLSIAVAIQTSTGAQDYKTWKDYGGGPDSSHFVDLRQIDKSNVGQLDVAWTYPTGDSRSYVFNPIVVDNVMYVLARNSSLVALDAATGKEIWVHDNLPGLATRGIAYWESKDRKDRRLIFAINNYLQEIDARTGKSILTFGNKGLVDLRQGLGRDPRTIVRIQPEAPGRVFENLIMLGSSTGEAYLSAPGDIRAYDVRTGRMMWSFHTIPHPGEEGYDTWPKDAWKYSGGANTWGEITVDEKRGIAYFPTGSPTYDYYGADRIGSNLFANCLLALDARTGKRLWHYQMVHHDLWDYDANAAPQLITVRHNGRLIDAVSQSTKQGFLFVFDRVTGKPLWPIEERPVPKSQMPGEQAWPTQPHPTVPPPYARQQMTAEDVNPYILTAEERAAWKDRISKMRNEGLFTPPGFDETISLPGARGGSNWGTNAANPAKGLVYLTTQDWPTIYKLGLDDPLAARNRAATDGTGADQGRAIYEKRCQACHGPNGNGSAGGPPALARDNRLELEAFRQVVAGGRADMPAFADLDAAAIAAIHAFLGGEAAPPSRSTPNRSGEAGPVVASGGAPGGLEIPALDPRPSPLGGPAYPDGVETPANRYYTDWGLYPNQPYIIGPPWSAIVAYDLNSGTIKWRVPLGEDARAAREGAKDAGVFMAERHGIIVTSTGLLFVATSDGKVRAHDEETGRVLWTAALPAGSEGVPAMYEVNGRQYLVVPATSPINTGGGHRRPGEAAQPEVGTRSYVAFALPEARARR
ncbi:MAG: pyrroloquinoline quinone-dependent dehydrogenase [Acidobacteria bacterium]|nr:MAG: pyrroloquinoline quinone-dependent dehydrogenase [Acidobacteriota bacterium]